jgi:hypothetical protein
MNKSELKKLSKIELEELSRTKGIELDRRYNKNKLVNQIFEVLTSELNKTTAVKMTESVTEPIKVDTETIEAPKKRKSWKEIYNL